MKTEVKGLVPLLWAGLLLGLPIAATVMSLEVPFHPAEIYATVGLGLCILVTAACWWRWPAFFAFQNMSLPGLFAASAFGMMLLPLPLIVAYLTDWDWWAWITVLTVGYVFTFMGIAIVPIVMQSRLARFVAHRHRAVDGEAAVAIGLLVVCLLLTAYWVMSVRDFALFSALSGNSTPDELKDLRENALKLLEGPVARVASYLRNLVFPYTTTMLFVIAWTCRKYWAWALFIAAFIINLFVSLLSLEKLYGALLLIQMFFCWMLVTSRRVSYGVLITAGLAVIAIFLFVTWFFLDPDTSNIWFEFYSQFVWRVLAGPAALIGAYIDYFTRHDYLLGQTMPLINHFFAEKTWIENIVCREYFGGGETCHANSAYIVYLWADFGWIGVIAGGFGTGMIMAAMQFYTMIGRPTAAAAAMRSTMAIQVLTVSFSSFFNFATWAIAAIVMTMVVSFCIRVINESSLEYKLPMQRT